MKSKILLLQSSAAAPTRPQQAATSSRRFCCDTGPDGALASRAGPPRCLGGAMLPKRCVLPLVSTACSAQSSRGCAKLAGDATSALAGVAAAASAAPGGGGRRPPCGGVCCGPWRLGGPQQRMRAARHQLSSRCQPPFSPEEPGRTAQRPFRPQTFQARAAAHDISISSLSGEKSLLAEADY